ncbi:MAG TPA: putative quinol monooxygenase [Tepidisphaeraceae bacterium]|jgi:quinol monooxygenase YgiN|nr:putative quinol monooxygenase [Tepidisphaeraceae bacterium]
MFVVIVTIHVKPENQIAFREQTLDNARNTRKEPDNLRFDVLQSEAEPNHFTLYEAYKTKDGFVHHQTTAHYARWKAAVADWMAKPREAVKCGTVFFGDE